jgi:hypothetical protein
MIVLWEAFLSQVQGSGRSVKGKVSEIDVETGLSSEESREKEQAAEIAH